MIDIAKMLQIVTLKMYSLYIFFLIHSVCVADLYQVNRTNTLCYSDVAEFVCYRQVPYTSWTITSRRSEESVQLNLHSVIGKRTKSGTIDSATVRVEIISGDSSFISSRLTVDANLQADISCQMERVYYQSVNSKYIT